MHCKNCGTTDVIASDDMMHVSADSLFTLCAWTYEAAWYGDVTLDGA